MKNILVVSDSYGNRVTGGGKTFNEVAADITGCRVDMVNQAGASLANGAIVSLITGFSGDVDLYDTVIYVGGANDETRAYSDYSQYGAYFSSFKNAVLATFPNVKNIYVMPVGQTFQSSAPFNSELNRYYLSAFRNNARLVGVGLVENSWYVLRDTRALESDMCHPNANGVQKIGEYLAEFILNGEINVYDYLATTFTDAASNNYSFTMRRTNNVVTIQRNSQGAGWLASGSGTTIPVNGTYQEIGEFADTLINADNSEKGIYCAKSNNGVIYVANGAVELGEVCMYVENKKMKGYLTSFLTSGVVGGFHITGSCLTFVEC